MNSNHYVSEREKREQAIKEIGEGKIVYLNMYTQKNQKYLIHNVAFTVKKGYEPPEKETEAAPAEATEEQTAEPVTAPVTEDTVRTESVTPAVTEEAGAENGVSAAVAIAVGVSSAVIAGGIAYIIILLNRKKPEGKQNEEN